MRELLVLRLFTVYYAVSYDCGSENPGCTSAVFFSFSFRIIAESRDFFLAAAFRCTTRLELA